MRLDPLYKIYCPCLRLKMGEYTALLALAEDVKDHVLPYFIAPPPKDRDPEHGRRLRQGEILTETAKRIGKHWPLRPAMLDTSYISAALGSMTAHVWLPELFSHINRLNGRCIPVLSFDSSSSERIGVREIFGVQNGYIAIRVPISYVDDPSLFKKLYDIVNVVGCEADRTIIVLDCEDMSLDPAVDTFPIIKNAIEIIASLGNWAKFVFVATSYPDSNPAAQNGYYRVERLEVELLKLLQAEKSLSEINLTYGDYGADCSLIDFSTRKGGRTIAHLRLTTPDAIHVYRGGKNLGEHDDGTIRSVAKKILESPHFDATFNSAAEDYIIDFADRSESPGNPTTWRKVNTIRHITCTVNCLLNDKGVSLLERSRRVRSRQLSFLDEI